jgi:hypothetical protein
MLYRLCSRDDLRSCVAEIQVEGTAFSVERYPGGWLVRALLGEVRLVTPGQEPFTIKERLSQVVQDGNVQLALAASIRTLSPVEVSTLALLKIEQFADDRPATTVLDAVAQVNSTSPDGLSVVLTIRQDLTLFDEDIGAPRPLFSDDVADAIVESSNTPFEGFADADAVDTATVVVKFTSPRSEARMLEALDAIELQIVE